MLEEGREERVGGGRKGKEGGVRRRGKIRKLVFVSPVCGEEIK